MITITFNPWSVLRWTAIVVLLGSQIFLVSGYKKAARIAEQKLVYAETRAVEAEASNKQALAEKRKQSLLVSQRDLEIAQLSASASKLRSDLGTAEIQVRTLTANQK